MVELLKPRSEAKVVIGVPHGDLVPADLLTRYFFLAQFDSMGMTGPDGARHGGKRRLTDGGGLCSVGSGPVIAKARNDIVTAFLRTPADWLLWLDPDMVWTYDLIERMVQAAHPTMRPIVGALCFQYLAGHPERQFWPTLYTQRPGVQRLDRLVDYPANSLIKVTATGAACLIEHRSVLEAMATKFPPPRAWFNETPFVDHDEEGRPMWETAGEFSEDVTHCLRARACGFEVMVHTGIKVGHTKQLDIGEEDFLAERDGLESILPNRLERVR